MSSPHRLRGAVIGAGPAGFYAADQLLGQGFEVDLYDVLPTPFGLVRAGVAPDHPKIKSVTRVYEKTAAKPGGAGAARGEGGTCDRARPPRAGPGRFPHPRAARGW